MSLSLDLAYHNQESCQDDACQPLFPCLWRVGEETPWAGLLKAQRALVQYREATQAAGPLLCLGVSGSTGCLSGVLGVGGRDGEALRGDLAAQEDTLPHMILGFGSTPLPAQQGPSCVGLTQLIVLHQGP